MSSTNRGSKRVANDFYETPSWCVDAIMPHLPIGGTVLDPCAGKGAILIASSGRFHELKAIEINPDLKGNGDAPWDMDWMVADALNIACWPYASLVLMNPPFSKAEGFVSRSLEEQKQHHGTTCALLRLSFLASIKRRDFMQTNPCDVYVLSKRPSFNGLGTDSCDYAWFVWGPGRGGRWFIL